MRQTQKTLALIILLILPMAAAISLGIGYVIAGRVLAPISAITRKAEEISAENLSERLPVDLAELVRETVEFLNVLAEEKRQCIKISECGKTVARIDRASIRQALTNLLDNAIKYTPPESDINITVGTTAANEAFVEIADSGVGIPENDIQRIFDRFYRVDKGRSREMGGAGLGLAITKWAVESNGGRIEVESTIQKGSVFRVLFPMQF